VKLERSVVCYARIIDQSRLRDIYVRFDALVDDYVRRESIAAPPAKRRLSSARVATSLLSFSCDGTFLFKSRVAPSGIPAISLTKHRSIDRR